jgi:transposase InsO family protein
MFQGHSFAHAREKFETWRCGYKLVRLHSSFGYLTPAAFAQGERGLVRLRSHGSAVGTRAVRW